MNIPILTDLVIIFSLSLGVLLVCHRLRIPVTVGFILTGILAGPDVLGMVKAVHEVEMLAEIGIVLLLFCYRGGIFFSRPFEHPSVCPGERASSVNAIPDQGL